MGVLKDNYTSFLNDIEKNIKDKDDLNYIKMRFTKFLDVILDQMDHIMDYKKEEIDTIEKKQKEMDEKMEKIETILSNIEKDIYSEDGFDFEIVCPYCNYEFVIDIDEEKTEVECPECHNIIELDWSGEIDEGHHNCSGSCSSCHGCEDEEYDEDDMAENDEEIDELDENDEQEDIDEENEDDM